MILSACILAQLSFTALLSLPYFIYRIFQMSLYSFPPYSIFILMFLSFHGPQRNRRATVQTTHVQQQRLGGNVRKKFNSVIVFDYSVRMCFDVFCSDVFCSVQICFGCNSKFLMNADLCLSSKDFYWIHFFFPFLSIYFCLPKLFAFTDTITLI